MKVSPEPAGSLAGSFLFVEATFPEGKVICRGSIVALAALRISFFKVGKPFSRSVGIFCSMRGEPLAHLDEDRCVNGGTGNDCLPFAKGGKLLEKVAAHSLDTLGDATLINGVDDAHDALSHTLGKHVSIEFPGPLANQAYSDTKLAALGEDLLENLGSGYLGARRGIIMRLFDEDEDRVGEVVFIIWECSIACGIHTGLVEAAQKSGYDDLLFAFRDLV